MFMVEILLNDFDFLIVPTLCVGMQPGTLRVPTIRWLPSAALCVQGCFQTVSTD
jgi:hypothetical protein